MCDKRSYKRSKIRLLFKLVDALNIIQGVIGRMGNFRIQKDIEAIIIQFGIVFVEHSPDQLWFISQLHQYGLASIPDAEVIECIQASTIIPARDLHFITPLRQPDGAYRTSAAPSEGHLASRNIKMLYIFKFA